MIVKIQVPAIGSLESYLHKPVIDRFPINKGDNRKEIGKIIDAQKVNDEYELTMDMTNIDVNFNLNAGRVISLSVEMI